ncbi:PapB/FocB family fimbrial expression transcriptional regulator (plasmid) [Escherichia albertii]|nr:PapB/FocB family fimbrial expression transcriptional regulator [Escherichia albertii]MCU7297507.1 adhesin biosynthesis transcription regulatory family protein [Escherichia albertii]MCU7306860.1 adhesin biosynthesis transcription regulatory family protein [Escherichia albertii]MCU7310941.1 adhesin biosynthesis transcription regulatory family protein [Escherichia albertii]MCZ8596180.1 PapB/FocB family fimbrial expression transcriptional regulator [Escherichia albertii]MCZ8629694.1 PapB/FocB f
MKRINGSKLTPASLSNEHFWMLIEICPVYSEKMIRALRDFLVLGKERKNICELHNVSLSYFSVTLGRVSYVNEIVSSLTSYYCNDDSMRN